MELTQRDLAEKVGVYQPYIARLEAGLVSPGVVRAQRLAKVLRTTVEKLFGR